MRDLEKEFVPYKESLELKEIGFDEPCFAVHYEHKSYLYSKSRGVKNSNKISQSWICTAPTFSQAFGWFRKMYGIPSHIATYWQHDWNDYSYQYYFVENKKEWNGIEHYKTYEEAELACLIKLIEIVKKTKQ